LEIKPGARWKKQVSYEKHLVSEDGHGMHHLDNQVELNRRIETFLAKNRGRDFGYYPLKNATPVVRLDNPT